MAIVDRDIDDRLSFGTKINPLVVLIGASMILFVVLAFFKALLYLRYPEGADVVKHFENDVLIWVALSSQSSLYHPWTFITHAFVHTNIWQLFGSMIWLWAFGYILIDLTGNKKLIPLFIYGALVGAAVFMASHYFFPTLNKIDYPVYFGSGAAIMAIIFAATTISPHYKVFPYIGGGIPLWIIAALYVVVDLSTIPFNHPSLYLAHLAGGLTGFLFIFLLRKGFDGSEWMNNLYDTAINTLNPDKPTPHSKAYLSARIKNSIGNHISTQDKLDEILDKINQHGFDSLSVEEKNWLRETSMHDLKSK